MKVKVQNMKLKGAEKKCSISRGVFIRSGGDAKGNQYGKETLRDRRRCYDIMRDGVNAVKTGIAERTLQG